MTDIVTETSATADQEAARAPAGVPDNYGQDTIYRHPQEGGHIEPASRAPIMAEYDPEHSPK